MFIARRRRQKVENLIKTYSRNYIVICVIARVGTRKFINLSRKQKKNGLKSDRKKIQIINLFVKKEHTERSILFFVFQE